MTCAPLLRPLKRDSWVPWTLIVKANPTEAREISESSPESCCEQFQAILTMTIEAIRFTPWTTPSNQQIYVGFCLVK